MYYEEEIIDEVLCYRTHPHGRWIEFSTLELTNMLRIAKNTIDELMSKKNKEE